MLRLTLAQMRRSIGRLTAAAIAIVIGTAFVAATLLAGNLITRATYDAISAQYAQADLVVTAPQTTLTAADLEDVRSTLGVVAAYGGLQSRQSLESSHRTVVQGVIPMAPDLRLMPLKLADGDWPTGAGQVALPPDVAERLGVDVGDTLKLNSRSVAQGAPVVTVTGLVEDPKNAFGGQGGAAVMDASALHDLLTAQAGGELDPVTYSEVAVILADRADVEAARTALHDAVPAAKDVVTPDEHAQAKVDALTGGENVIFMVFVLAFAAIALLVAGLVIANTFQVLVAQRTRTLATLRAVGATKRQIGQSVLVEAAMLGAVSSLLGVALGCGLGQLALVIARHSQAVASVPATITITWQIVLIPLLVGVAVTVLAAFAPARGATRVAPLAAMRPDAAPSLNKGSGGRARFVLSLLAVAAGAVLLGLGVWLSTVRGEVNSALLVGVAGGTLSFVGVTVSAVFWLPKVVAMVGHIIGCTGPTTRLAVANTLRNPRRTVATSTALLIGVTLVTLMATGAASARASLGTALSSRYPIDLLVRSSDDGANRALAALPQEVVAAVERTGVTMATVQPLDATVTLSGTEEADGSLATITAMGIDPAAARATLSDDAIIAGLAAGSVVVPPSQAEARHVTDGDRVTLTGPDGTITLTATVAGGDGPGAWILASADLKTIAAHTVSSQLWASLRNGADDVATIQDAISDTGMPVVVAGVAVQRESYQDLIDTVLSVVLALLGVAIIIALIGVANTLSLSVIERGRESATLRAIGVTRGQLRRMLAVEGMLIAGVSAVLGILIGLPYGWGGALAALGAMGEVQLGVPWRDVVLAIAIALVAGLVASVAPGRSATKPSPVAALATE